MVKLTMLLLVCALGTNQAHAVNKCTGSDGKISFQDAPCSASDKAAIYKVVAAQSEPDASSVQRSKSNTVDANNRIAIRVAINERRPLIGMTISDLVQALGVPNSINSGTYASGSKQQRVYYLSDVTWYVYVDTDKNLVTSFQQSIGGLGKTPTKPCPSNFEIRSVETSASSITLTDEKRREYAKQLYDMRNCGK